MVASLTPWNFPCSIQARKLAPALAAGCTVVARVSEKAPLAATEMVRRLSTPASRPVSSTSSTGRLASSPRALLDHEAVRAVTFTGSTPSAARSWPARRDGSSGRCSSSAATHAFIVFDDADVEAAVEGALLAKFRNTGQSCIAANRFIVHEDVYDEFVQIARRAGRRDDRR